MNKSERRGRGAYVDSKGLKQDKIRENEPVFSRESWQLKLITHEQRIWHSILGGAPIEVTKIPEFITPEVQDELERRDIELCFIPQLYLPTIAPLDINPNRLIQDHPIQYVIDREYLKIEAALARHHPGLREYSSLSEAERRDPKKARGFAKNFWKSVLEQEISLSEINLPGHWVGVEKLVPVLGLWGEQEIGFIETPVYTHLGFTTLERKNYSWQEIVDKLTIGEHEELISLGHGLQDTAKVRLPNVIELMLLRNRDAFDQNKIPANGISEFSSTHGRANGTHLNYASAIDRHTGITQEKTMDTKDLSTFRILYDFSGHRL